MKYLLMILAIVMIFAGQALAADGNVSHDLLTKMGLSSLNVMSDAQGTAVRGMRYAAVYGANLSVLLGSSGTSGYKAVGKQVAVGSAASIVTLSINGSVVASMSAGGCSIAITHK